MYKNRIQIRIDDKKVLNFLEEVSKGKNLQINKLIYECIEKYIRVADSQNNFESINNKIDKLSEQAEALQELNKTVLDANNKLCNYLLNNCLIALIILYGGFKEYKYKKLDAP